MILRRFSLIIFALLLLFLPGLPGLSGAGGVTVESRPIWKLFRIRVNYVGCHEGDTCTFSYRDKEIIVRLANIDAPDIEGACPKERRLARKARVVLNRLLSTAHRIELTRIERHSGHLRARVRTHQDDASVLMLLTGRVRYHFVGDTPNWCE